MKGPRGGGGPGWGTLCRPLWEGVGGLHRSHRPEITATTSPPKTTLPLPSGTTQTTPWLWRLSAGGGVCESTGLWWGQCLHLSVTGLQGHLKIQARAKLAEKRGG